MDSQLSLLAEMDPALRAALVGLAVFVVVSLALRLFLLGLRLLFGLRFRYRPKVRPEWVVVDGSNVMHWGVEVPQLEVVKAVLQELRAAGLTPLVWFDANVGYKVVGRFLREAALARFLDLPERQIRLAPKGTPADPLLLSDARRLRAAVVSNDRFRDWAEEYPEVLQVATFLRGRMIGGTMRLDVVEAVVPTVG